MNGEIYNHVELREELESKGHRFATHSDCEVVVHGYEEHGEDFVRRLNGMFGLALWDSRRGRLVAARDPFGVKPLYWWTDGRRLALASEIGALLAAGVAEPRVDRTALDHFLACRFVPAPRTLFEGIRKLAPATLLIVGRGRLAAHAQLSRGARRATRRPARPRSWTAELASRFVDAVERQMMSDVPYGAFLSGGVDSAAIAAAMAQRSERAADHLHDRLPGPRRHPGRARVRARVGARGRHRSTTTLRWSRPASCPSSSARVRRLEEPVGIPSAPGAAAALALRRAAV